MHRAPFFTPAPDWVGDTIPFVHEDTLYVYYLHHHREANGEGTSWHLLTTTDLITRTEHGEVLPHGTAAEEDLNCYTGSVVTDDDGLHHLFSTAQNPARTAPDGRPLQLVAHATSTDLQRWEPAAPLWDPRRFLTQECPEVFRIGEWWYLVYSEFTDAFVTRYRMSRSPEGPWHAPRHDSLDARSFYAAKSATWKGRRIFAGWIATREGRRDDGPWQWAGTLSLLEAVQQADGTLDLRLPPEVLDVDARAYELDLTWDAATNVGLSVGRSEGGARHTNIGVTDGRVYVDRGPSDLEGFSFGGFRQAEAPIDPAARAMHLRVLVDTQSVEVFVDDGYTVLSQQVHLLPGDTGASLYADGGPLQVTGVRLREH